MNGKLILEEHYGQDVWVNKLAEPLRSKECLCLNCRSIDDCGYAAAFFGICQKGNIALMVTRCRDFLEK